MRIFYDVDTQKDFMYRNGALAVPNAEEIIPNLKKLTGYASDNGIKILGSVDRHFGVKEFADKEKELARWGGPFPDHCMDGTDGQKKIRETLLNSVLYVESGRLTGFEYDQRKQDANRSKQIIFEKQSYDVFHSANNPGGNQNIESILKFLGVTEAVVYGVATDYCVKAAVMGMREKKICVYVVKDAIKAVNLNPDDGRLALEEMTNRGAILIETGDVLGDKI